MYISYRFYHLGMLIALLGLTGIRSVAQTQAQHGNDIKDHVKTVSGSALDSAASGNSLSAIKSFRTALKEIPEGKEYNTYRAFLLFNLGFVYRNYGQSVSTDHLGEAVEQYQAALKYQPNDHKITNNLVLTLLEKGDNGLALEYLREAIKDDPGREGAYYSLMGDIYVSLGENENAWEAYRKATTATNPDQEAGRKLLDLYDEVPSATTDLLLKQCKDFEDRNEYALARLGYGKILAKASTGSSEDPDKPDHEEYMADTAVVNGKAKFIIKRTQSNEDYKLISIELAAMRWTAISAQLGFVSPKVFVEAGLDQNNSEPVTELQYYVSEWQQGSFPANHGRNWWRQDALRKFHLIAFEKTYADNLLQNGKTDLAIALYENVLDQLWYQSDYSKEIYGRPDVLLTDILIVLARLYNNPKEPKEEHWKELERKLFDLKGEAYATNDLTNRQKYHTILGQIYFERGEYTGLGFMNAEFQLTNAIRVAERRAEDDPGTYYPIPNLYQNLAKVYLKQDKPEAAYDAYLSAAIGYLESDHVTMSGEQLQNAAHLPLSPNETRAQKYAIVQSIQMVRTQIPELTLQAFDPNHAEFFQKIETFKWLKENASDDVLSKDILSRQRFKVLSDLGVQARQVGATDASVQISSEAKTEMKNVKVMSSQQDVIRLRNMEVSSSLISGSSGATVMEKNVLEEPKTGIKEKTILLATPPGTVQKEAVISKETLRVKRMRRKSSF